MPTTTLEISKHQLYFKQTVISVGHYSNNNNFYEENYTNSTLTLVTFVNTNLLLSYC